MGYLRQAALVISRTVQQKYPEPLAAYELDEIRKQYQLSQLLPAPARPAIRTADAMRSWLGSVLRRVPADRFPQLAEKLFSAEYNELTRGPGSEYYYLYPIPAGAGSELLILTVDRPGLAYFDDSRRVILYVQIAALAVVALVYFALSRFIFNPFRRLKEQAVKAGRLIEDADNETDAIVQEYETVIKQLKRNEAELLRLNAAIQSRAESLEQLNEYLLASSEFGIVTLNPEGTILAINPTAGRLLRLESKEFIESTFAGLPGELGELCEALSRAIETGTEIGYREYAGLFEDHPDVVLGVTISFIRNRNQNTVGLLVLINDLTELSRLRRELESRERLAALGEMAGGLAHQIRNSLGAISGYATLIRKRQVKAERPTETVSALLEETREAGGLIDRFLAFARPFEFTPELTSLDRLIEGSLGPFRVRDDCREMEFQTERCGGLEVMVDGVLMKQALGNIIDNAIGAYHHRRGLVKVSGGCLDDQAAITIEDYGCGIPPDELEKIYTPFFSSRPAGTGLGLPLARKIIDLHGGRISVESELGKGTRFTISWPRSASISGPGTKAREITDLA